MNIKNDTLPDDPELLKKIIAELNDNYTNLQSEHSHLVGKYTSLDKDHSSLEAEHSYLEEKYKSLQRMLFGKKSEKLTPEDEQQMRLFNEIEDGVVSENESEKQIEETTEVKSHTRKKKGRKPLPDDIPREEIIHDLPEEEKNCPCCGKGRPVIGEESTEELDIIPAQIVVKKHIRKKYGPCGCDDFLNAELPEVKTAPAPPRLVPHSIVSPGLAAYIVTAKFCDALPFYRQSKIFERLDIDICRATLCNWAIGVADKCAPLIDLMTEEIRSGPLIQMDETTVQVLNEPGRKPESKSYMWVVRGYTGKEKPLLVYQYHPSRSGEVPKQFLEGYMGYLQTDGYGGYNRAVKDTGIIHVGCFAHARRYFEQAYTLNKKSKIAYRGLEYIKKIYAIENDMRNRTFAPEVFIEKRQRETVPVLEGFHNWLKSQKDSVLPQSKAGEAIQYILSEWSKLVRYLDHHLLTPDNNLIENAIRPFVLGRKNWLFSNTPRGAHASATLYSLIESAKANGLEPYHYLRYLFHRLPGAVSREELRLLLPDMVIPEMTGID